MRNACLLVCLAGVAAQQQVTGPVELTTSTFSQAAAMPVAWLLQLESPYSQTGQFLAPVMRQLAQYYHGSQASKGVRIGTIDMQKSPELQRLFCDGSCPPLLVYQKGKMQVLRLSLPQLSLHSPASPQLTRAQARR